MVTLHDSLVSSASRILPLRKRHDLSVRYHRYQGKPYWVVKEPVGLKYFRFQEEEFAILNMLDGKHSFTSIKEEFERQFAPQKINLNDLQHFIGMLHRSGLLVADAPGQGRQLYHRRWENVKREWISRISNVLAMRFKGLDPERFLNFLIRYTDWLFTKWAVMFFCLLGISALTLLAMQFDTFRSRLPGFHEFFGPHNWIWLGLTLAVTKVLHELGHGLSCKHFGGECHEIGVMILVLTPCLYCNVSDSWLLPNKWHRAAIGAAGMYIELMLASIATFVWWFSDRGLLLNNICLSVMFICSVSTVIFNGNPLLRFDGYYILADIMEIPNLRQKSSRILQRLMSIWCLGLEEQEDPFLPQRNHWFFALYTIAAVMYRWLIVFSILMFLNRVLEPYGLKVVGQAIAAAGIFGLVVMPIYQLGKFLHVPGRMHQVKRKNVSITAVVVAAILGFILLVPLPYEVKCPMEIAPKNPAVAYALVPGRLEKIYVRPGQLVKKGEFLFGLFNLPSGSEAALDSGQIPDTVRQALNKPNRTLPLDAGVSVLETGRAWQIIVDKANNEKYTVVNAGSTLNVYHGDLIARLVNPDLELSMLTLRGEFARYDTQLAVYQQQQFENPQLAPRIPELKEARDATKEQLDKSEEDVRTLWIKAPRDGVVIPAPLKKPQPDVDGQLPMWSGSLFDPHNLGAWLDPNDQICLVGDQGHQNRFEARLYVDQSDIGLVQKDQTVKIKLDGYADKVWPARIANEDDISRKPMAVTNPEMSNVAGGGVATRTDPTGLQRPLSATFQVTVALPDPHQKLRMGLRGRAKIAAPWQTIGWRVWRFITKTFHFDL